jgi:hypothetical protein
MTDHSADAPLFGDGPVDKLPFRLRAYGPDDDPETGHIETFYARRDISAGSVIRFLRASDQASQLQAAGLLIINAAVNHDGLSDRYEPPVVAEDDPRLDPDHPDHDPGVTVGQVDVDHPAYDPRWTDPAQWSSRRRLNALLDDPDTFVQQHALIEIARWLVQEGARRPTGTPRS